MATRYTFTDDSNDVRLSGFLTPEPAGTFNGGTITGKLVIADPDPAALQLEIQLPAGTSTAGTTVFRVNGEGAGNPLQLDAYGTLTLRADTVDTSNGGGSLILKNAAGSTAHILEGDNGSGVAQAGFFGHAAAAQPLAIANAAGGAIIDAEARTALNALLAAVRTLGLIAT